MLKPIETETREIRSLDGLWNFRVDTSNEALLGFKEKWYKGPLSKVLFVTPNLFYIYVYFTQLTIFFCLLLHFIYF